MKMSNRYFDERIRQTQLTLIYVLPEPRVSSVPFYFIFRRAADLDVATLFIVSKVLRIVPLHDLAVFTLLIEN